MGSRTLAPALRQLITGRPVVQTKGLSGRVRTFFRQYTVPGQPYTVDWNTDRAVREGFEVNPWIYRAVHVTASRIVGRKIVLRQDDPDTGVPLATSADPTRLLHMFNVQANPWERAKVFRYRLIALWLLSSKGVFIEIVRSRAGRIGMMMLLDPDMVETVPTVMTDANGQPLYNRDGSERVDPLGAYRVTVNDGSGPYNTLPRFNPKASFEQQPKSVLWVRSPHPTLMFRGMSPMQAAALTVDMDRAARMYNKRFMDEDGRPGGLVLVKGNVVGDTLEIIEAKVNGGPASRGRLTALQGDAMDFVDTSGSPRDTQWSETMDRTRKEASMVFGVPESVLGDSSGRTFDNADAEKANWMEDTLQPLTDMLDDQLDILTGAWDDALFFRHDWSTEWVLNRHKREEIAKAAEDFDKGRITLNEYRKIAGLSEVDDPAARVFYLPGGRVIAGAPDDVAAVAKLPTMGVATPADPAEEARRGAQQGSVAGVRAAENVNNARSLRIAASGGERAPVAIEQRDMLALTGAPLEGKQGGARDRGGEPAAQWR